MRADVSEPQTLLLIYFRLANSCSQTPTSCTTSTSSGRVAVISISHYPFCILQNYASVRRTWSGLVCLSAASISFTTFIFISRSIRPSLTRLGTSKLDYLFNVSLQLSLWPQNHFTPLHFQPLADFVTHYLTFSLGPSEDKNCALGERRQRANNSKVIPSNSHTTFGAPASTGLSPVDSFFWWRFHLLHVSIGFPLRQNKKHVWWTDVLIGLGDSNWGWFSCSIIDLQIELMHEFLMAVLIN